MIDWSKPIMHSNGEAVELVRQLPIDSVWMAGMYEIFRPNETQPMAAYWYIEADGKCGFPDLCIVNVPEGWVKVREGAAWLYRPAAA